MREWLSRILPAGAATDGQKSQETDVPPSHVHIDEDDQDMFGRREMEALIGRIRERLGQAGYALDTPPTEVDAFDREVPWYRSSAGSNGHQVVEAVDIFTGGVNMCLECVDMRLERVHVC